MKSKPVLLGLLVLVLLLIGGGYFFLSNRSAEPVEEEDAIVEEELESLSPEEIGLEMTASSNKKQVKFVINKPEGITGVEYELTYTAGDGQQRGVIGMVEDISGDTIESKFLDLGSCSSGTCKYDTGVETVNLLLKVTKEDEKTYQVEDSLDL
jgi:hypothetical protein